MATLQSNSGQLLLDGVDVSAYFTEVSITVGGSGVDISAGADTAHVEMGGGLRTTQWDIKLAYDVTDVSTYVQKLQSMQTYTATWRPEGNNSGKPEHVQSILINSSKQTNVTVGKDAVLFEISAEGADAPTTDMFAGGTV